MNQYVAKRKAIVEAKNFLSGILYLFPSIIFLCMFMFYPLLKTIYLSFYSTDLRGNPIKNIGLGNYISMFSEGFFLDSLKTTFIFAASTVIISIAFSLLVSLLANENLKGTVFFGILYTSTLGISIAAGATIWLFLFHPSIGMINNILSFFHIPTVNWLTEQRSALVSVIITTIWMNVGFNFLILTGGLKNIPGELYESAKIDGAGYFRQLFNITIPMLSPTLFFISVVSVINALQSFGQVDILTRGGPSNATNLVVYSIYKEGIMNYRFGPASAQAVVLFIMVLLLTLVQFRIEKGKVHY